MTDPDEEPTGEDAVYASLFAFVRKNAFLIALIAPPLLLSLLVKGEGVVLLVMLAYLGEAIVYAAVRRRRTGVRSGPGPALQALWVGLASLLIVGGLFGFAASGAAAGLVALALGIGIVAWMWSRVARASGEDSRVFVARIGRTIVAACAGAAGIVLMSAVVAAIGLPVLVVGVVAFIALVTVLAWGLSRTLR
jgi:hypothetical protein